MAEVGTAIQQMDQMTQQNAALVEEMAAAASSLQSQAQALVQAVSVFDLGASGQAGGRSSSAASALPALAGAGAGPLRLA